MNCLSGPDQLLPATSLTATRPDGAVVLRDVEAPGERPPISMPTLFRQGLDSIGTILAHKAHYP